MKGSRWMYNGQTIILPGHLPEGLKQDFRELQEYYDTGDRRRRF